MSQFDFPRIHVRGLVHVNVGTANNDDYAKNFISRAGDGSSADLPLRLADSDPVQPTTYNKPDDEFRTWAGKKHSFIQKDDDCKESPVDRVPGEWNYFGDMGVSLWFDEGSGGEPVRGRVVVASIQTDARRVITASGDLKDDERALVEPFLGAFLSYKKRPSTAGSTADSTADSTAMIIDVVPEGSSQGSQIFADNLLLEDPSGEILLSRELNENGVYKGGGQPSKASTYWLNFQRNVALRGPSGAAGTFQTVVKLEDGVRCQALKDLFERYRPAGETRALKGVVFRFSMFRVEAKYRDDLDTLEKLNAREGINPAIGQIVGTLAPWYDDDEVEGITLGRLLSPPYALLHRLMKDSDPPPRGTFTYAGGNGPYFRLAPLVARVRVHGGSGVLSLDVANTFPEQYGKGVKDVALDVYRDDTDPQATNNPKLEFNSVKLKLTTADNQVKELATLAFDDPGAPSYGTRAYYLRGGMIDIPLDFTDVTKYTEEELANGALSLEATLGDQTATLTETDLMVIPGRPTLYAEQKTDGSAATFNFNGDDVPSTLTIYKKGKRITEDEYKALVDKGQGLVVKGYWTTPLERQDSDNKAPIETHDVTDLGYALQTKVNAAGSKVFAVTTKDRAAELTQPRIDTLTHPLFYVRILPNEDYSKYYVNPGAGEREIMGNASLTFDVIYEKVLRNYHLLYPGMSSSRVVVLNDPEEWASGDMARRLLARISASVWSTYRYMPRTRDLSRSRRELIAAWCNKIINGGSDTAPASPGEKSSSTLVTR